MANTTLTQTGVQVQADLNLTENLQEAFSTSSTYSKGSIVIYDSKIWKCHTAVSSAGSWTGATNWTQIHLSDLETEIPTITIELSQVVSQDPVQIQLTDAQYNVLVNNLQVIIDLSDFDYPSVIWHRVIEETDLLIYSFAGDGTATGQYHRFVILKSTKEATFEFGDFDTNSYADGVTLVGAGELYIYGQLSLTGQLPYLTTAPSSNNTSGYIKIVVLSSEPATKYDGYLYIITGSNS